MGESPVLKPAHRDLEYVPGGGERNMLDLYLPATALRPLPLLIWIHGGGWAFGLKEICPAAVFIQRGYAIASINYRLSGQAVFPAQIIDCKAAVRWLRKHAGEFNLDPERFGAWGPSAGGHLAALLGTSAHLGEWDAGKGGGVSSRVQAVCDCFGPTDLLQMSAQSGPDCPHDHDAPDSLESKLIGGALQENKEKAVRANPIRYITRDCAPFLIIHGDADTLVPLGQSIILHEALKAAGVESELRIIPGGGHGNSIFTTPEMFDVIDAYFRKSFALS
jgi:acetyl esterase/lipase